MAKLRTHKTDDNLLLLKMELGAGHFSVTGRCARGTCGAAFDWSVCARARRRHPALQTAHPLLFTPRPDPTDLTACATARWSTLFS